MSPFPTCAERAILTSAQYGANKTVKHGFVCRITSQAVAKTRKIAHLIEI